MLNQHGIADFERDLQHIMESQDADQQVYMNQDVTSEIKKEKAKARKRKIS